MKELFRQLFTAIDKRDANGFVSFLTDNASFRFANAPAVSGKEGIRQAVRGFFAQIKGLSHRIDELWQQGNTVICEGEVVYIRLDGSRLTVPFVDIFRLEKGLIANYRIYIDISTLFSV